ncbi:MAG: electron transfer flavoprotein subunit beta [Thermoproteota archaeon]|nr:MAG: electron transfer flavoprotein subunit beta [Candidatus Korarchaeota archaeon]
MVKQVPYELVVCIKQVPDPRFISRIRINPETKTIIREGVPAVINPLDKHALEEALRIREQHGGRVTVVSMGPLQAEDACKEALAMGADRAVLITDRRLAGSDTLATALALSKAIRRIGGFDLVLCGAETVDGSTGQVPPQLAEFLGVPHVTRVFSLALKGREAEAKAALEYGYRRVLLRLPAVVSVIREINEPRIPSVSGILRAHQIPVEKWTIEDIGLSEDEAGIKGSPTIVSDVYEIEVRRKREVFQGPPEEAARWLFERIVSVLGG